MAGTTEVGRGGLEPPRPCGQQILSLSRLPFRHQPSYFFYYTKKTNFAHLFIIKLKTIIKFSAEKSLNA